MECFAFGLGVGHQKLGRSVARYILSKALCRPDPAVVSIVADVFDWDGSNLTREITADDLDDFQKLLRTVTTAMPKVFSKLSPRLLEQNNSS